MPEQLAPDLCVIGSDPAGIAVAMAAVGLGVPVAWVTHNPGGGLPAGAADAALAALRAAATHAQGLKGLDRFGLKVQRPKVDFFDVAAHVDAIVAAVAVNSSPERLRALGIRVVEGTARFVDRRTIEAGDVIIRARRVVMATGSLPAVPSIPGLEQAPYLTERSVFALTQAPKHLIVLGAGAMGLALAQAHRRLGAQVTLLDEAAPLAAQDPESAAVVLAQLAREGVTLHCPAAVSAVEFSRGKLRVVLDTSGPAGGAEGIQGTHLLVTTGYRPSIDGLDLAAAGIAFAADGICVDKGLRTSNRRVFAVGAVAQGGTSSDHAGRLQARLVLRKALFRLPTDSGAAVFSQLVRTDPELAQVGLDEAEARQRHGAVRVLRASYLENERAQAERATAGHLKVITSYDGHVLGATIVGAQAGELITAWTVAIGQSLRADAILAAGAASANFSEISVRGASGFYSPGLTNTWVRRIIPFLRRFG